MKHFQTKVERITFQRQSETVIEVLESSGKNAPIGHENLHWVYHSLCILQGLRLAIGQFLLSNLLYKVVMRIKLKNGYMDEAHIITSQGSQKSSSVVLLILVSTQTWPYNFV